MSWKNIKIDKINSIEKCVAEFNISALSFLEELYEGEYIPYGGFKVKIYETQNTSEPQLTGYTNIGLKAFNYQEDGTKISTGDFECSVGFGRAIEEALENTINNFMENVSHYRNEKNAPLTKDDFNIVSYDEF